MRGKLETGFAWDINPLIKEGTNRIDNEMVIDIGLKVGINQDFNAFIIPNRGIVLCQ